MTERERAINQDLHVLDEAHRLGRITRDEYRSRRRRVLESLYDSSGIVTARKALVPPGAATTPRTNRAYVAPEATGGSARALTTLLSMRPAMAWKLSLAWAGGLLVLLVLAYWLWPGH